MSSRSSSRMTRRAILGRGTLFGGLAVGLVLGTACGATAAPGPSAPSAPSGQTPATSANTPTTAPAGANAATTTALAAANVQPAHSATFGAVATGSLIHGTGTVNVLYAGSLVTLLEKHVSTAYNQATGFTFQGEGKGSVAAANLIKGKTRTPDIFISADPSVNNSLQGQANGSYVSWWVPFARTTMVVGWSPKSKFAVAFDDAKSGKRTWESVLEEPGFRLGRTDPELDPKGYRTLMLFQLDEKRTGEAGEAQKILGTSDNPDQVFPEEQLVARLQSGQLDAGIFYRIEAVEAGLPYLELPPEINQGDPARTSVYAAATYTDKKGKQYTGSPILYTVTIPSTARNLDGATAFVQFLLSDSGQKLLTDEGLLPAPPVVSGDPGAVPSTLKTLVKAP